MDDRKPSGAPPPDDPRRTSFLAILLYVLGFMGALAFAAWLLAALLRRG